MNYNLLFEKIKRDLVFVILIDLRISKRDKLQLNIPLAHLQGGEISASIDDQRVDMQLQNCQIYILYFTERSKRNSR